MKPGTYTAKVQSHAISETKAGLPQAAITFSVQAEGRAEGRAETITYFGSFKDGAQKHTIKALLACGLKGSNPAGALEIGKEVSIVVEDEEDMTGKVRTKVKWVNALGGGIKAMDQNLATSKLADLAGAVMQARQDMGIEVDSDKIPF